MARLRDLLDEILDEANEIMSLLYEAEELEGEDQIELVVEIGNKVGDWGEMRLDVEKYMEEWLYEVIGMRSSLHDWGGYLGGWIRLLSDELARTSGLGPRIARDIRTGEFFTTENFFDPIRGEIVDVMEYVNRLRKPLRYVEELIGVLEKGPRKSNFYFAGF